MAKHMRGEMPAQKNSRPEPPAYPREPRETEPERPETAPYDDYGDYDGEDEADFPEDDGYGYGSEEPPRRGRDIYQEQMRRAPRPKRRHPFPVAPFAVLLFIAAAALLVFALWKGGILDPVIHRVFPTPTPVPTAVPTAEPTEEPTPTPEPTEEPTPTPEPTATPEPTPPAIPDDGTEGYLSSDVLIYGNAAFELFYGSDDMAAAYASLINGFAEELPGIRTYDMVVPNHSAFGVPERVNDYYGCMSQRQNTTAVYENLSPDVVPVDVFDILNLHNNEPIYLNTDTHWSSLGAYYAYTKFVEVADAGTPAALDDFEKTTYTGITGYLAFATGEDVLYANPDSLDVYDPKFSYTCEASYDGQEFFETDINTHNSELGYAMFLGGDMGCVRITNNELSTGRKLLIMKDSYGNALVPFLTANFDEVHAVDFRYFSGYLPEYCLEHGITDVLFFNNVMTVNTSMQHDSMATLFN